MFSNVYYNYGRDLWTVNELMLVIRIDFFYDSTTEWITLFDFVKGTETAEWSKSLHYPS